MNLRKIQPFIMSFERKNQPVASSKKFRMRMFQYFLFSAGLLAISLAIGMIGYKYLSTNPEFGWDDAFLNASMILTGMGPILDDKYPMTPQLKIFSGIYAIYSGITFLSSMAIFFSPILHRFLHLMHMDVEED